MSRFVIHWDKVEEKSGAGGGMLFALWPAPVNPDECFRQAGFTDFEDADEAWDAAAAEVLSTLLKELSSFGEPRRLTPAATRGQPWHQRVLGKAPRQLSLREEIEMTLVDDQLPDCIVGFGSPEVTLHTGSGHYIFWITLPRDKESTFAGLRERIANRHPATQTRLDWRVLLPQRSG